MTVGVWITRVPRLAQPTQNLAMPMSACQKRLSVTSFRVEPEAFANAVRREVPFYALA